mmetsp:Transcript_61207/g.134018  ORF Transcript_61207/g.134018 Transcript_61207/m.134018 type:complete len:360 (+) Transcript_61207:76-1155(+)
MQIWWLLTLASLALSPTLAENCFGEQCEEDAQALIQRQSEQRSAAGLGVSVGAHISTLDGQRYPFAKCGTYEMWGLRGVPAKALGGVELDPNTKRPVNVNWQLLAHYSGSQGKIKGLLLQDLSNPTDALMQLTSDDCRWSRKLISPTNESKGEAQWTSWPMDRWTEPLSSGVTFVKLSNVLDRPRKHSKGYDRRISHVKLFMHTQQGNHIDHALVTDMKFNCRIGDQISTRVYMQRPADLKWVVGQIAPGKHSENDHFIPDQWAALGGSDKASFFLRHTDVKFASFILKQAGLNGLTGLNLLQVCDGKERSEAKEACAKHLSPLHVSEEDPAFQQCVDDACREGNAEDVAAEAADGLIH